MKAYEKMSSVEQYLICELAACDSDLSLIEKIGKEGVQLVLNGRPLNFSKFATHYEQTVMASARALLEERASEFEDKVRALNEVAERVTMELTSQVTRILPESITSEDCR